MVERPDETESHESGMKQKYTLSAEQYAEYQELKQARRDGYLLSADTMRMIVRACEGKPDEIGRHFLEVYARMRRK